MQWRMLWLCLPFLFGCERLNNSLQSRVLQCGEAARASGDWIKVLDPQGRELPAGEVLDARPLTLNGQGELAAPLQVSEKHCVNTQGAARTVIRSLANDRSWSAIVARGDDPSFSLVRLQDTSQAQVRLRCPEPWIQNGQFQLPLAISATADISALAFAPRLVNAKGAEFGQNFSLIGADARLVWPESWPDGPGTLILKQKNLLLNPRLALAEVEESCPLIIDRSAPRIALKPEAPASGELEMQPGSLLLVKIDDPHPAMLRTCLQPAGQNLCEKGEAWQSAAGEVSLPMPDQGRWILNAEAVDAAGNAAPRLQQTIDIVRRDLLQGIAARVDQSLAEKNEKGWDAGQSLLRSLVDYQRLAIPKEREQIRRKIADGILEVAPYLQEQQRATLSRTARQAWTLSKDANSPWMVLDDAAVSLWSAQGHALARRDVPAFTVADWSPSGAALALGTSTELWVFPLKGTEFSEPVKLVWSDYKDIASEPDSIHWIPGTREMLVTFPNSEPAIVEWTGESLSIPQRLSSFNSKATAVAQDGSRLATVDEQNVIRIWERRDRTWVMGAVSDELSVAGLAFAKAEGSQRLVVLLSDGRLISWSPGVLWKDIDAGGNGETPTESNSGAVFQYVQTWGDGSSGVMERGGRFYLWSAAVGKTLQPLKLNGFNWDQLRNWKVDPCQEALWLQDDRSLSFWEKQSTAEPGFIKRGEWALGTSLPTDFLPRCDRDRKKFVTWTGERLRFWSQEGPLPALAADTIEVVQSRFEFGIGTVETLFTAGFDKVIRLWTLGGQAIKEWVGHGGQINELRYLPEWGLFASSAEDASTRLWTGEGVAAGTLALTDDPSAKLRDGAMAFDASHLLTVGSGQLAIWKRDNNRTELTITVPLPKLERPGFDPMVRLPGDSRILVRLGKNKVLRALVVRPDGSLVTEPGLPLLVNLKWLTWTRDGTRLAWGDAQQKTHVARYQDGGWQEDALPDEANGLTRLVLSPDGERFAAVRAGRTLVIGRREGQEWSLQASIPLNLGTFDQGLQWSADSSRLVYAQAAQVSVRDREGALLHSFQAFPGTDILDSLGLSQDPERLAVGRDLSVRLIDLRLETLQAQLCTWLDAWVTSPEAPPEFLKVCKP